MSAFPALIAPVRQEVWGVPAVVNLCAGGAGSALYGLTFLLPPGGPAPLGLSQVDFIRLSCALLVAVGFAAVGIETRKPMNARFVLHHLRQSWMSREVLAGSLFIILALLDIISPHSIFQIGALGTGLLLLVCQVMMVYDARGVGAWNTPRVASHALSSNLCLACGLGLIFYPFGAPVEAKAIVPVVLMSLAVNLIVWWRLLRSQATLDLGAALQPLITPMKLTLSIGVGHMLPALMLAFVMGLAALLEENHLVETLLSLSGGMILIGGTAQKADIVLGANSLKAITPGPVKPGRFIHAR